MEQMTVARGLKELTLLDKRIDKAMDAPLAGYKTGSGLPVGIESVDAWKKQIKSDYQSITGLIERREKIKKAILISNSITKVKVGSADYLVVEAIEKKNNMQYQRNLRNKLRNTLVELTGVVEEKNEDAESRLQRLLEANFGKDQKAKDGEYQVISKPFMEANKTVTIDPIGLKTEAERIDKEIDEFETDVDYALSESNIKTTIEV